MNATVDRHSIARFRAMLIASAVLATTVVVGVGQDATASRPVIPGSPLAAEMAQRDWHPAVRCVFPIRDVVGRC